MRVLLADEMGLGKTLQVVGNFISVLCSLYNSLNLAHGHVVKDKLAVVYYTKVKR